MVGPMLGDQWPNLTSTARATPAWNANLLDPAQVMEVMEIQTTYDRPGHRALARTNEDRTPQPQAVAELGLMRSDWLGVRDEFRNWITRAA